MIRKILFLAIIIGFLASCKENEEVLTPQQEVNNFIYKRMIDEKLYYWYDQMNVIMPDDYTDSYKYLDDIIYKEKDKWSTLVDKETFDSYFSEGKVYAFGFGQKYDENDDLRICYVLEDSPMDRAGVRRGFKLLKVNNYTIDYIESHNLWQPIFGENEAGVTVDFELENIDNEIVNISISKEELIEKAVMYSDIIEQEGKKIGYIVFQTFIEPGEEQLNEIFTTFKDENIDELVVDLRYNSGGDLLVAVHFCNLIAGKGRDGEMLFSQSHNSYNMLYDKHFNFTEEDNSFDFERVFVISSKSSASASEALISGLDAYIDVVKIGDDTYGKPVGMYAMLTGDYYLLPVCFATTNNDGEGHYFDGIPADAYVPDGLDKDWGDTNESCLKEALYYIQYGGFSITSKSAPLHRKIRSAEMPENKLQFLAGNLIMNGEL